MKTITTLELELASKFKNGTWGGSKGISRTLIWYAAFILYSLPKMQDSHTYGLRQAYETSLKDILISSLQKVGNGLGLAYIPDAKADIGMTSLLITILLNDRTFDRETRAELLGKLIIFISHYYMYPEYSQYTYSWTWAMVLRSFSAINYAVTEL